MSCIVFTIKMMAIIAILVIFTCITVVVVATVVALIFDWASEKFKEDDTWSMFPTEEEIDDLVCKYEDIKIRMQYGFQNDEQEGRG